LGQPDMKIIGNRVYYVFNCPVNVLEKVLFFFSMFS